MIQSIIIGVGLILAPALAFVQHNIKAHEFNDLLIVLLPTSALALITITTLLLSSRTAWRSWVIRIVIAFTILWNLQFYFNKIATSSIFLLYSPYISNRIALLILIIISSIVGYLSKHQLVRKLLVTFAIVSVAIPSAVIILAEEFHSFAKASIESRIEIDREKSTSSKSTLPESPNVYYVILDGLGSEHTLKSIFETDISSTVSELKNLGYYIANEAKASYNMTYLALGGIFNTDYFDFNASNRYMSRDHFFPNMLTTPDPPPLIKKLTSSGYEFIHVGNRWGPCRPYIDRIKCLELQQQSIGARIINDYAISIFFKDSVVGSILYKINNAQILSQNDALKIISDFLRSTKPTPKETKKFYFVHSLIPHPPYVDQECRPIEMTNYTGWDSEPYKLSVLCIMNRIQNLARDIEMSDPDAIVVFQSDHGPATQYNFHIDANENNEIAILERFSIFNAIKLPYECQNKLFPSINNIGTINIIINCINPKISEKKALKPRSFAGYYNDKNPNTSGLLVEMYLNSQAPSSFQVNFQDKR